MEYLISEFTFLSDQSLQNKNFDPSTIENLVRLFEVEAYKVWAAAKLEQEMEVQDAEKNMKEIENYLESEMESAMEEYRRFEEEMNRIAMVEHDRLVNVAKAARRVGKSLEKAATFASNKYIDSAAKSASASMRSALKAISSNSKKVHPS